MPIKRIDTGLSRFDFDDQREHGYLVNLSRQRVKHVRRFSDGIHGGKREALKAARAWREAVIRDNPPLSRQQFSRILRKNNTSGVPGVYALKNGAGEVAGWAAQWLQPGSARYLIRKFSFSMHGAARAKRLAIAAREEGLANLAQEGWHTERDAPSAASTAQRQARYEAARLARSRDWRVARVRVSNVFVSLHFVSGAMLQLPIARFPALQRAKAAARNGWAVKGYVVTWAGLKLVLDARAFIHPGLAGAK